MLFRSLFHHGNEFSIKILLSRLFSTKRNKPFQRKLHTGNRFKIESTEENPFISLIDSSSSSQRESSLRMSEGVLDCVLSRLSGLLVGVVARRDDMLSSDSLREGDPSPSKDRKSLFSLIVVLCALVVFYILTANGEYLEDDLLVKQHDEILLSICSYFRFVHLLLEFH